jgi:hypothetical protein
MKNAAFWDMTPRGSCWNRLNQRQVLLPSSGWKVVLRNVLQLVVTANVPSSLILSTLKTEAIYSSETSFLTRATRRHVKEEDILYGTFLHSVQENYRLSK